MHNTLQLTLKKKWFDMIASGEKKEEYRELKPFFQKRLVGRDYQFVKFRNGYKQDSPTVTLEYKGFMIGLGIVEWGAEPKKEYYIIKLGRII